MNFSREMPLATGVEHAAVAAAMQPLAGLHHWQVLDGDRLRLRYDPCRLTLAEVEQCLAAAGLLAGARRRRGRAAVTALQERNLREQAAMHPPWTTLVYATYVACRRDTQQAPEARLRRLWQRYLERNRDDIGAAPRQGDEP